ncbi:transmembrane protein, putative, partial [Bodo saltans]
MLQCSDAACNTAAATSANCILSAATTVYPGHCAQKVCSQMYTTFDTCIFDPDCSWNATSKKCRENLCTLYDDATSCGLVSACNWDNTVDPNVCSETKCAYTNMTICAQDPYCYVYTYNQQPKQECLQRSCTFHADEASCEEDVDSSCWWDNINLVNAPHCREDHCSMMPTAAYCTSTGSQYGQAHNCLWISTYYNDECAGYRNQPQCISSWNCLWRTTGSCVSAPSCAEQRCKDPDLGTNAANCTRDPLCTFTTACALKVGCPALSVSQVLCASDSTCMWDTSFSPAGCNFHPCRQYTNSGACPSTCSWSTTLSLCLTPACSTYTTAATCVASGLYCFWGQDNTCVDARYSGCKATDFVFLVDGSADALMPAGRQKQAMTGVFEDMLEWVTYAPLTGTTAGTPVSASTTSHRVGVLKSGDNQYTCASAGCRLTGSVAQYRADSKYLITSPHTNVMQTSVMDMVAPNITAMFANSGSRNKILIILAISPIYHISPSMANVFSANGITVLGISLNDDPMVTESLRYFVPEPKNNYLTATLIDTFDAFVMDELCMPFSIFSPFTATQAVIDTTIVTTCRTLPGPLCATKPFCDWNSTGEVRCSNGGCPQLNCIALHSELSRGGYQCDNCVVVLGAVRCDLMTYNPAQRGTCGPAHCSLLSLALCSLDSSCFWNATRRQCLRSLCVAANATACEMQQSCLWDTFTGVCFADPCVIYNPALCAEKSSMCESFDGGQLLCKISACPYNASECRDRPAPNPLCAWNPTSQRCQLRSTLPTESSTSSLSSSKSTAYSASPSLQKSSQKLTVLSSTINSRPTRTSGTVTTSPSGMSPVTSLSASSISYSVSHTYSSTALRSSQKLTLPSCTANAHTTPTGSSGSASGSPRASLSTSFVYSVSPTNDVAALCRCYSTRVAIVIPQQNCSLCASHNVTSMVMLGPTNATVSAGSPSALTTPLVPRCKHVLCGAVVGASCGQSMDGRCNAVRIHNPFPKHHSSLWTQLCPVVRGCSRSRPWSAASTRRKRDDSRDVGLWLSIAGGVGSGSVARIYTSRNLVLCSYGSLTGLFGVPTNCEGNDGTAGNLVAASCGLVIVLVLCLVIATSKSQCSAPSRTLFTDAMKRLAFPSCLMSLFLTILPTTAGMSIIQLVAAATNSACDSVNGALGVLGLLCCIAVAASTIHVFIWTKRNMETCKVRHRAKSSRLLRRLLGPLMARRYKWKRNDSLSNHEDRHVALILQEYRFVWFFSLDTMILLVIGVLAGVAQASGEVAVCAGCGLATTVLYLIEAIVCAIKRPFTTVFSHVYCVCAGCGLATTVLYLIEAIVCAIKRPFTTVFSHVYCILTLVLSALSVALQTANLIMQWGGSTDYDTLSLLVSSSVCDLCIIGISFVRLILDLLELFHALRRLITCHEEHRANHSESQISTTFLDLKNDDEADEKDLFFNDGFDMMMVGYEDVPVAPDFFDALSFEKGNEIEVVGVEPPDIKKESSFENPINRISSNNNNSSSRGGGGGKSSSLLMRRSSS